MAVTREAPAAVAATLLKVAVLLEAGTSPGAAWRHVAEAGDDAAARIAGRLEGDRSVPEALEGERGDAWREVAAAWEIAATVGAPLAPSLRGIALALRDAQEAMDDVRIALAEPASTARLMTWLPVFGVVVGLALGFDVVGVLFTHPIGIACLVVGIGLLGLARWWTSRLVRGAQPPAGVPGIHAELTAIALGGGASIERARSLVGEADTGRHLDPEQTESVLDLSRRAGVPAVDLLRATAVQQRHDARTDGRLRAARLGGRLLLPLGVCTLPAFVCLGVAPMLIAVLSSTSLPALP
ncbi:type II secretion system F family protein [Microbacterium sediminis]|uniref:Pilus assembly protein TadB n=1 Tax=Microbacterium sediminis TaxID=904291 RepID=A0A1B9NBF7_9MICO|nr:type II secretion system F family protein [Microbacterium sediminis]OCG73935.1 pilus assembly protein TadB [Microbacterium sediminis]